MLGQLLYAYVWTIECVYGYRDQNTDKHINTLRNPEYALVYVNLLVPSALFILRMCKTSIPTNMCHPHRKRYNKNMKKNWRHKCIMLKPTVERVPRCASGGTSKSSSGTYIQKQTKTMIHFLPRTGHLSWKNYHTLIDAESDFTTWRLKTWHTQSTFLIYYLYSWQEIIKKYNTHKKENSSFMHLDIPHRNFQRITAPLWLQLTSKLHFIIPRGTRISLSNH